MLPWGEPELQVRREGRETAECEDCRGPTVVDAEYSGAVRCSACWAWRHGVGASGTLGRRRDRRYAGGRTPSPHLVALAPAASKIHEVRPHFVAYRVLIPARPAATAEIPRGAASVASLAAQHELPATLTYALAEETATGALVRSCAVRIGRPVVAAAVWINGAIKSAFVRHDGVLRKVALAELEAGLRGEQYAPPAPRPAAPRGPCPRCGHEVRWRIEAGRPVTWKHNRPATGEGERNLKILCVQDLTPVSNGVE